MPKMKSNRLAGKKFRVNAAGKLKRAQANVTHNTGKRAPKRMRRLRHGKMVDDSNMYQVGRQLPYRAKGDN